MELTWIGRYRKVVASIIRYSNVTQRVLSGRLYYKNYDLSLATQEWQVLEYLLEHPDNIDCMAVIADQLGIVPSTFSKCTNTLVKYGLAEKYQTMGNRKNIVLRISEKGQRFYEENAAGVVSPIFSDFFEGLAQFSDEQLAAMAHAIDLLADQIAKSGTENNTLVKIE